MIREFETNDIDTIMSIWLNSNIEAHDFIHEDYWKSHYDFVEKELTKARIYVYEDHYQILGFAGMMGNYLAGIFVSKEHRSTGIGKCLLDYIKKRYPDISLNVYQKNEQAVNFYLREGFIIKNEGIDEDTKEKDYVMKWERN